MWWAVQDENRAAAHNAVSKATVRLCLARGSQRLGMSTKKDAARPFGLGTFFVVAAQDSNSSGGDRRLRRKQGAEAGAAF